MFEHIGMVAGMKGVAVAEHGGRLKMYKRQDYSKSGMDFLNKRLKTPSKASAQKTTSFPRRRESIFENIKLLNKIGFLNFKMDSCLRGNDGLLVLLVVYEILQRSQAV